LERKFVQEEATRQPLVYKKFFYMFFDGFLTAKGVKKKKEGRRAETYL